MYEIVNLSIRTASDTYKTLPHQFQLICNNALHIQEISLSSINPPFNLNLIPLNQVNTLPLNSIIGTNFISC